MQSLNVSDRLARIAAYLPKGAIFADIGSDHAYLPCYVCENDHTAYAIAGEVNKGPYLRAKQTIHSFGLTSQIDARLGNGLQVLHPNEVSHVVISGMGGTLIRDILHGGIDKLHMTERIIVQPNIGESTLRKFLVEHQYALTDEELVEDNGHIYEILIADKKNHVNILTEKELFFGPFLLQKKSELFQKKWSAAFKKRQRIVEQMKQAYNVDESKVNQYIRELAWIEEVLQHGEVY